MADPNFTGNLQEFYTEAREINELMVAELGDVSGKKILEPAVGKGAFLVNLTSNCEIDAVDVNPKSIEFLNMNFASHVNSQCGDFINYFVAGDTSSNLKLSNAYDAAICNPPYGLKFTLEYRKKLKTAFPKMYVRESYGLFMFLTISLLRDGGRFSFIVPDTFLSSKNHKPLRQFLTQNASINKIFVFNSSRFESVNYGYGSMCVVSGAASNVGQVGEVDFINALDNSIGIQDGKRSVVGASRIINSVDEGWAGFLREKIVSKNNRELTSLGEIADCKTGIYTGDNVRFCAFSSDPRRKTNGFKIDESQIFDRELTQEQKSYGISSKKCFVPFVRGGHWGPFEGQNNYIDWSISALKHYRTDKKARLQNASFYFRSGIAVPMVTSGRISASYMQNSVFDQGVVGIFPRNILDLEVLLVLLNSAWSTEQKLSINPSANNSANYLKRIMLPKIDDKMREKARVITKRWYDARALTKAQIDEDCSALF